MAEIEYKEKEIVREAQKMALEVFPLVDDDDYEFLRRKGLPAVGIIDSGGNIYDCKIDYISKSPGIRLFWYHYRNNKWFELNSFTRFWFLTEKQFSEAEIRTQCEIAHQNKKKELSL